jgi:pseudaminic acid cytidylyltransferase
VKTKTELKEIETQTIETICIIPPRKESKRVPNKNFREIGGKPIIEYSIDVARDSKLFDEIIVSTDSNYQHKDVTIHKRDKDGTANDTTGLREVVLEILMNEKYTNTNTICLLYPTALFTTVDELKAGKKLLENYNVVFPVKKTSFDLKNLLYEKESRLYQMFVGIQDARTRQIMNSGLYEHVGAWFCFTKNHVWGNKIISRDCGKLVVDWTRGQDVNTEEDWLLMEAKFNKQGVKECR